MGDGELPRIQLEKTGITGLSVEIANYIHKKTEFIFLCIIRETSIFIPMYMDYITHKSPMVDDLIVMF